MFELLNSIKMSELSLNFLNQWPEPTLLVYFIFSDPLLSYCDTQVSYWNLKGWFKKQPE